MNIQFDSKWKYIFKTTNHNPNYRSFIISVEKPNKDLLFPSAECDLQIITVPVSISIPGITDVDNYLDTLHQIVDGCKLVKCHNFKINDPVVVWNNSRLLRVFRHFKEFNEETGEIICFDAGMTSWSVENDVSFSSWSNWRLPTTEELKERGYVTSLS